MSDDPNEVPSAHTVHSELYMRLEQIDGLPDGTDIASLMELAFQTAIAESLIGIKAELEALNRQLARAYTVWYKDMRTH